MKLPAIIVSDLHLTDRESDKYRWSLFPWLVEQAVAEKAHTLVILGDITDAKDYHSAKLVNLVVRGIALMRTVFKRVIILRGNHDSLVDQHVFFEFLSVLDGVQVITKPTEVDEGTLAMFLPWTRTPADDWAGWDFSHYNYLFLHQSVAGAVTSNGTKMEGTVLPAFNAGKTFAGDIHVPQVIGDVEYIGAPYHVHHGDNYRGRAIVLDRFNKAHDLHLSTPKRVMLDVGSIDELSRTIDTLAAGDQVKVRLALSERNKHMWSELKTGAVALVRHAGLVLNGIELKVKRERRRVVVGRSKVAAAVDPTTAVLRFVEADSLGGDLLDIGLECIE